MHQTTFKQSKDIPIPTDSDIKRFWDKINFSQSSKEVCWEWKGVMDKDSYGRMYLQRKQVRVNRIAFFLGHGINCGNMQVCHTCDNPKCCNPLHLFLGTAKDNRVDCLSKGRQAKGEIAGPKNPAFGIRNGHYTNPEKTPRGNAHHKAKLKESDIGEIFWLFYEKGFTQTRISKLYKVSQAAISGIVRGVEWWHLGLFDKYKNKATS